MDIFQGAVILKEQDITHLRAHELLENFFGDEAESKDVSNEIITNLKLLDQDLIFSSEHSMAARSRVISSKATEINLDEYEKEVSSDEEL